MMGQPFAIIEKVYPKNIKFLAVSLNRHIRRRLWLQVLIGMILGIITGLLINPDMGYVSRPLAMGLAEWLALPGNLFLAFIQMIVVPLILSSIIRGISAATDVKQLKSTGLGLAAYFLLSTIIAAILGITIGLTLKPGSYVDQSLLARQPPVAASQEVLAQSEQAAGGNQAFDLVDLPSQITDVLPTNPMNSIVEGEMLQIVIFAIILGIGLLSVPVNAAKPLLELIGSVQEICMAIVSVVMTFAPFAVFGLLAQAMIKTGPSVLTGLTVYTLVVILGMAALLAVYLLIAFGLGRRNPIHMLRAIREPILLAFSTNSSAATMPVTVKSAEEELHVRPSLAQFIVPLGATMNMGGTALYQALATIFMAQLFQMDLPLGVLVALVATTVGASIGTPAVPGVGIVVLASVLSSAGVPLAGLTLIVGLDRLLERFRTSLNVTGDLVGCVVMERFAKGETSRLEEMREAEVMERSQEAGEQDVYVRG